MTERNQHRRELILRLPGWVDEFLTQWDHDSSSDEAKMRFVIELARRNIERQTGGPFAAAVFDAASRELVALGINLVEPANCSIAHAEMVALALAQQTIGSFDLSQGARSCELVTSAEPCAMCLGAIPWSGVRHVICGARGEDACAIGFDEGAKPNDWIGALASRQIKVTRDVLRDEARAVLNHYHITGGRIYNARSD